MVILYKITEVEDYYQLEHFSLIINKKNTQKTRDGTQKDSDKHEMLSLKNNFPD